MSASDWSTAMRQSQCSLGRTLKNVARWTLYSLSENRVSFATEMERFLDVDDATIDNLMKNRHSKNSNKVIKGAEKVLNEFCAKNKCKLENMSNMDIHNFKHYK